MLNGSGDGSVVRAGLERSFPAVQISNEFGRFSESMAEKPRIATFYGGFPEEEDKKTLKSTTTSPHIVVGTPGRIKSVSSYGVWDCYAVNILTGQFNSSLSCMLQLMQKKVLKLASVRHFVLDECDKMLESVGKSTLAAFNCLEAMLVSIDFHLVSHLIWEQLCFADMRQDVQEIFKGTPHEKQVMMFSATLSDQMRPVCRRFMDNVSSSAGGMAA